MTDQINTYEVFARHIELGNEETFEVDARDEEEAIWKIQKHQIFNAESAVLVGKSEVRRDFVSY
ncbi:MAG: hypothetical protein CMQ40_10810 [Gammaproteobacteria bacterium]|nr:hypothetical protein [Gammaproteobacteria bacterium]